MNLEKKFKLARTKKRIQIIDSLSAASAQMHAYRNVIRAHLELIPALARKSDQEMVRDTAPYADAKTLYQRDAPIVRTNNENKVPKHPLLWREQTGSETYFFDEKTTILNPWNPPERIDVDEESYKLTYVIWSTSLPRRGEVRIAEHDIHATEFVKKIDGVKEDNQPQIQTLANTYLQYLHNIGDLEECNSLPHVDVGEDHIRIALEVQERIASPNAAGLKSLVGEFRRQRSTHYRVFEQEGTSVRGLETLCEGLKGKAQVLEYIGSDLAGHAI